MLLTLLMVYSAFKITTLKSFKYMMNSVITILYFNGRVYEKTDGVIFEGKYVALQICDDEDVETMIESFQQQEQMSILELYIEKDVAGGSMFDFANSVTSCENNLSNNEAEPPRNVSNVHGDEDDDDDDYLMSNSYIEESLDEDDSIDGIFDTDDEFTNMIQPVRIVHPTEGIEGIQNPFWNDALHYNNINWSHPDEEDICGLEMSSSFNVGQEYMLAWILIVKMREDPSRKVSLIQERINNEFIYKVSYKKAWMVKQKVIAIEYGDWEEPYTKLSSWLTHMQNHSPGSYFQILHDDFIVGNRVSREHQTFKYCKPIIQVDGTHLYDKYRGTLLMATSQYGNGGVLPLAFAVVEGETLTTWSWFLAHLREHVIDKNGICLISYRHVSTKSTVANEALGRRYGHMTTNLSECTHKVSKDCRNIPITVLVKSTYSRCQKYFVDRGRQAQRKLNEGQVYCSKLVKELRKNQEQACSHIVRVYDIQSTRFQVEETFNPITQSGRQKWYYALHYPCSHIIAARGYVSMNYFQYIDVVYTNKHILKAYSAQWWPLGNEVAIPPSDDAWTLIPDPTIIHAKSRPKSTRIRNEMD
ncbi:hypothetical protein HKD37_06G017300 [Glycine soja]